MAKQKQNSISAKLDLIESTLEKEKSKTLEEKAKNMIAEMTKNGYSNTSKEIKYDVEKEFKKTGEKATDFKLSDEKLADKIWGKRTEKDNKEWTLANFGGYHLNRKKITESEALYKVAVSDGKITLKEAIDIGIAGNIALQAARKKVEVAEAKVMEAKRALFPTAQMSWQINGGIISNRPYKGENRQVKLNQPLYYGGELTLTVKQAEENLRSSKAEYEKNKNEYIHQVRTAYYGAVKGEYNVQYQVEVYRTVYKMYQRIRDEHNQRLISEADYLNAESQYQQIYFQVESSRNDFDSARIILYQTVQVDSDKPLPLDLELKFVQIHPDLAQLMELAMRTNPDVRIKAFAEMSAKYGVDVFKAKKVPHFDLRGSYGYQGEVYRDELAIEESKADNELQKEWYLGIHGSMPLGPNSVEYDQIKHQWGPTISAYQGSVDWTQKGTFNLFDKFSDITDEKNAEAAYLQSKSDFEKARNDLSSKLREDFFSLQKALIQIDSSVAKIRYQEKQNGINEYMVGLQETTAANYFEGLIEYAQSRFAFIQAVVDYHLAVSSLSVQIGDPYYFDSAEAFSGPVRAPGQPANVSEGPARAAVSPPANRPETAKSQFN